MHVISARRAADVLTGCYNMPGGDVTADGGGANTVNGSIHVPAGTHSESVGTVNGSIHIDENAVVASAGTVNGSVALGAHATADASDRQRLDHPRRGGARGHAT